MATLNKPAAGNTSWYQSLTDNWTTLEGIFQSLCQGRLTLTSGVPVTTSDVTAAATLYFTPFRGNRIGLYTGSLWSLYAFTEISLSLSGFIANVTYDIFIYDNSGTLTLDSLAWKKVTATSSPTTGANKTINVPDTSGVSLGSLVTVRDGTNSEIARVNAVVANTSITVDNLVHGYTTPDIYYPSRATMLTSQDGIYVKGGDATRRFLGTIRMTNVAGQCEDSQLRRFVSNYYNRVAKSLFTDPAYSNGGTATTYSNPTGNFSALNSGTGSMVEYLANGEDIIDYVVRASIQATTSGGTHVGVGEDNVKSATCATASPNFIGVFSMVAGRCYPPAEGYHFLGMVGYSDNAAATVYADWSPVGSTADPYGTYLTAMVME